MINTVLGVLCILLAASSLIMFWYVRRLIYNLNEIYGLIRETLGAVSDYEEHLEKVYNMDTFYGDNTLQGLLDHSRDLKKGLEEVGLIIQGFFDAEPGEEEENAEEA